MTNTIKTMVVAGVAALTTTAALAGNPEGVLNNQVEEPIIVEDGEDWRLIAGVAALGVLAAVAIGGGDGGGGGGGSSTTTTD